MQKTRQIRKPDLLSVLILLAGIGVFTSTQADASDSVLSNVQLFKNALVEDMRDGDVRMTGSRHAGLHLSSHSQGRDARYVALHDDRSTGRSGVHLSWKMSW